VKHSLDDVLEETLNEVEKLTGSLISFYHFVDPDEKSLTLQNWSTRTKKEFCKAEGKGSHYEIAKAGVWVDCVCQRKPVIYNDYASIPHKKGYPSGHAPVIRFLAVPVMRADRIKAILGVGNKRSDYNEQDKKTVSLFADLAWDIAGRMRAEGALRESEKKYRNLVENINDVIFSTDKNGVITYISPSIKPMSGYSPSEIIGRSFSEFLNHDDLTRILNQFQRVLSGVIEQSEYRIIIKSGEIRWVRSSIRPILEGDLPIGLQGTITDITDRKLVEKTLRKSEAILRNAQEIANIGSWEIDLVSNQLTWSDEVYRIFGLEPQEFKATYEAFLEAIHPDDRTAVDAAYLESIRNKKKGYEITHRIIRKESGEIRYVEGKCIHHRNDKGEITHSIGTVHDITDRKEIEELRRITQELQTFNEAMLDREERIIQLKGEVNRLAHELGRDAPYEAVWEAEDISKEKSNA
jgi:PAS domain S-box-containing protein